MKTGIIDNNSIELKETYDNWIFWSVQMFALVFLLLIGLMGYFTFLKLSDEINNTVTDLNNIGMMVGVVSVGFFVVLFKTLTTTYKLFQKMDIFNIKPWAGKSFGAIGNYLAYMICSFCLSLFGIVLFVLLLNSIKNYWKIKGVEYNWLGTAKF